MKLAKSLLLGSAAALATVAGAQAADLPVRKAAPVAVEYVRVCSTFGAGFFVIPGTDSCLKIGGRVRFDALVQERFSRAQDTFGFRARGRMSFDVRTPTPYGPLRTFVRVLADRNTGSPFNGGVSGTNDFVVLDQGFVQFGPLLAGRVTSRFSPQWGGGNFGTLRFDDGPDTELFALTYSFGNGFSATISAESPHERDFTSAARFGTAGGAGFRFANVAQGGYEFPDVVGQLLYSGTWGSAQISGAIHQITDVGVAGVAAVAPTIVPVFDANGNQIGTVTTNPGAAAVAGRRAADDEIGFAVAGYLQVNLPQLAAGDYVWLAATYADGALGYLTGNAGSRAGSGGNAAGGGIGFGEGNLGNLPFTEATLNVRTREIETTEGFSVAAGIKHWFIPTTLETNLFGSFLSVDYPAGAAAVAAAPGRGRVGFVDFDEYRIGGNVIWRPVTDLQLGVEVLYTKVETEGRIVTTRPAAGAFPARVRLTDEEDFLEGRFRVQRDF